MIGSLPLQHADTTFDLGLIALTAQSWLDPREGYRPLSALVVLETKLLSALEMLCDRALRSNINLMLTDLTHQYHA